jgi:hypothetical protein
MSAESSGANTGTAKEKKGISKAEMVGKKSKKPQPVPHPLDPKYEEAIFRAGRIDVVVIGESPYEEKAGPAKIPFMTEQWVQLRNPMTSGQYVVQSITGRWIYEIANAPSSGASPCDFACGELLRRYHAVLLNAAYALPTTADIAAKFQEDDYITDYQWDKARDELLVKRVEADWMNNQRILQAIRKWQPLAVVSAGVADKILREGLKEFDGFHTCHPSLFNVQEPARYQDWLQVWDVGQIKDRLKKRISASSI